VDAGDQIHPSAELAGDVEVSATAVIHGAVRIGSGSRIGANAVVHAGTQIGDRCLVEDGAILGKRPRLRRGSSAAHGGGGGLDPLVLEPEVTVCAGAVVYAGATLAAGVIVGDRAQVRERAAIGPRSVVGGGSSVDFDATVGARVLIQTGVYVTAGSIVEDDVFIGPGVVTSNDDTMGRHPPGQALEGPVLRRACRVGAGAVLVPGVVIGEEAFVAAGALVTKDVPARAVVMGVPARVVREVPDTDLLERWRLG